MKNINQEVKVNLSPNYPIIPIFYTDEDGQVHVVPEGMR